jgi:uncharacterized protein (UPF0212 family)
MITEKQLNEWSNDVDAQLPHECPSCHRKLDAIRYVADRDTTTVRITGAGWSVEVMKALCPKCGHELKRKQVGGMSRF